MLHRTSVEERDGVKNLEEAATSAEEDRAAYIQRVCSPSYSTMKRNAAMMMNAMEE